MAISISIKKFKGREYVYIVDSYRDPITKRPTGRILVSFGSKEKLLAADPDAMTKVEQKLKELQNNSLAYSNTVEQRLSSGAVVSSEQFDRPPCLTCTPTVFHPLWDKLGLTSYFRNCRNNYKLDYDLDKTVFFSCVSRLVKPASKLSAWHHRRSFITDFAAIDLQRMYDSLDVLAEHKDHIIKRLNKSLADFYQRDLTVALYDVSTFYFESFNEGDLRRRGMSKEHRTQETQVVLGLLIDAEGIPFTYELFPGNTAEVGTLLQVIAKFKKQYEVKDVIVVADSGLNQLINLDKLHKEGMRFIVGYPPYIKMSEAKQKQFLAEDGWQWLNTSDNDRFGYKTMELHIDKKVRDAATTEKVAVSFPAVCIGTFSQHRFHHDIKELNLKWSRAVNLVNKGKKAVAAANRSGYKAFIKVDTQQAEVNYKLYDKRRLWCGYSALLTNIENPDPQFVYGKLRQLWRIEDNFRMLKTNLEARPVFVWTDKHIRGHFVLNYIALVMQKLLLKILRDKGLDLSSAEVIEALESMKISHLKGLKKANNNLYCCSNVDAQSGTVKKANGENKTLKEICDEILRACGMEPLNSLETASTIRRKLKLRLAMQ